MKLDLSLSVVITALNEEGNVSKCLEMMLDFLEKNLVEFEVIFVNDGSIDRTGVEAEKFSSERVKIIHLEKNLGTGGAVLEALKIAKYKWYCWFPCDLEVMPSQLKDLVHAAENSDVVVSYFVNGKIVRTKFRQFLSSIFTKLLNVTFGKKIKYFNGISLIKREIIPTDVKSRGFFFHSELLLKSLMVAKNYVQIPIELSPRVSGESKAIRFKVLLDVMFSYLRTFWEINFKR